MPRGWWGRTSGISESWLAPLRCAKAVGAELAAMIHFIDKVKVGSGGLRRPTLWGKHGDLKVWG